jgi:hypothetical protein
MADVKGIREIQALFDGAPLRIQKNAANSGTQTVATEVRKKAEQFARSHGGGLARLAAKKVIIVKKVAGKFTRQVGWKKPWSRLAHLFEFGTAERVQKETGRRTGRMAPKPHLRSAVADMSVQQVEALFVKGAARRFMRDMAKK